MNIKRLNEEIEQLLEISDKTKSSYLAKRKAQADAVKSKYDKALKMSAASDERQFNALPKETSIQNAKDALNDLKYEMRKISQGSDWRLENEDDYLSLSVRYWGQWEGDDGSGDYDWQSLADDYKTKLKNLVIKTSKKYNVKVVYDIGEKNWISFDIKVAEIDLSKEKERIAKIFENMLGKELPEVPEFILSHTPIGSDAYIYEDKENEIETYFYINDSNFNYYHDPEYKDKIQIGWYSEEYSMVDYDSDHYFINPGQNETKIKESITPVYNEFYRFMQDKFPELF